MCEVSDYKRSTWKILVKIFHSEIIRNIGKNLFRIKPPAKN